jgi:hypothetical protein
VCNESHQRAGYEGIWSRIQFGSEVMCKIGNNFTGFDKAISVE